MKPSSKQKEFKNKVLVTSEDLFIGLPFAERVVACVKLVESKVNQYIKETSIMLDLAREGAPIYVSCRAENDTDICATLAQLDIEAEEIAFETMKNLKGLKLEVEVNF